MAKGDQISVRLRVGNETIEQIVTASQNGRTVTNEFEKEQGITWLVVRERTRGGTVVQTARFLASEVLSLVSNLKEV